MNTTKWNCYPSNMANVPHFLGDKECEDFFRMNMNKHWSWFHQKLLIVKRREFCRNTNLFHIMQTVLIHLFGYNMFSSRKLIFDELKDVVNKCQLPMLLVLRHHHSKTQKHVVGVSPSAEGYYIFYIVDGKYSKCITISFISDALDSSLVMAANF